jgi:hypothetical protein
MEGVGVAPGGAGVEPPPPPHPKNVMASNAISPISHTFNLPLHMIAPFVAFVNTSGLWLIIYRYIYAKVPPKKVLLK